MDSGTKTLLNETLLAAQFRHVYMVITFPSGKMEKIECNSDEGECLDLITTLEKTAEDWTLLHLYVDKGSGALPVARWGFMSGKATRLGYRR
jgi:hypothetical protein